MINGKAAANMFALLYVTLTVYLLSCSGHLSCVRLQLFQLCISNFVGLVIAIIRGLTDESIMERSWQEDKVIY